MKTAVLIISMAAVSTAFAQGTQCSGIKPDKARLACYDKNEAKQPATAAASPAAAKAESLPEGVVFKSGKWHVNQKTDVMTDKKSCTALYQNAWLVQGTANNLFIAYRGRGGVKAYTLRIDDAPADGMQLATKMEKDISAAILESSFDRLYGAKRLRIETMTVLDRVLVDDIDLNGFKEAVDFIREKC